MSPPEETFAPPYPAALERFPTLRQSQLQSFNNCALTSYFDAEFRRGWSQPWQARGQMLHRVAAECLREMARLNEESIPVDAALSIMRDLLRQDEVDRECPYCAGAVKPGMDKYHQRTCEKGHRFETEFINLPTNQVKDLFWVVIKWAHENTFDIARLVDVEYRLQMEVRYPHPMGGSFPRKLTGKLDATFLEESEDGMVVIDWKDTWGMPPETEVSFEGYFQQRFYALLIFANYPSITRVTLREFYVRFSATREVTVTRADEPELHSELAALAERFDRSWTERIYPATPGKHCGYCIRPGACPIPEFAREDGRIVDEAVAEDLARQLIVGEQVVKGARAALRAYSEVHGPIPVRDAKGRRALGFVERESTLRPSLEELEQAERLKGGPLNPSEIRALYRKRRETRFTHFTPEDVDEAELEAKVQRQLEDSIAAARQAREAKKAAEEPVAEVVELDSRRTE